MSVVEAVCKNVAILDHGSVAESGSVSEVFSHPKSLAAKRLVFPEGNPENLAAYNKNARFIRVVFNGADAADRPLIAKMATDIGIDANIAFASTKTIGGRAYGSMLLSVENKTGYADRVVEYLTRSADVYAEEVSRDVQ